MGKFEDLTGKKFNMWIVLGRDTERENIERKKLIERLGEQKAHKRSVVFWKCRCECGEIRSINSANLLQGKSKSCGNHMPSPPNFKDLTGQTFNRLTVISRNYDYGFDKVKGKEIVYWNCMCSCGNPNIIVVSSGHLTSGHTKSCGCVQKESANLTHFKDLTNKKFGKLRVLSRNIDAQKNGNNKQTYWNCICDCGVRTIVTGGKLVSGYTRSCGCVKSYGELVISEKLNKLGLSFKKEHTFEDCISNGGGKARFDFGVKYKNGNLKYLIEFDGPQHFSCTGRAWDTFDNLKRTQDSDRVKNNYCFQNNIPLIRIPFYKQDNITLSDVDINKSKWVLTPQNIDLYYSKALEILQSTY